ncbi:MAG: peptidylprolyl isomerase [Bacteroidota bacterium]
MRTKKVTFLTSLLLFFLVSCGTKDKKASQQSTPKSNEGKKDTATVIVTNTIKEIEKDTFRLSEENAIDFFFDYAKNVKENKVRLTTSMGSFTIQLYNNVPYHKANFIYLTKKGYFDNTQFHRVVPDFIIQGGNSDDKQTSAKRKKIGRYLLPPDTRKGHKHHRGTISMPSSERDNPYKLASPFEFFIVVTKPGSYHLDGSYTPFGRVIEGMDVVDKINQVDIDQGEWPMRNVYIVKAEVL